MKQIIKNLGRISESKFKLDELENIFKLKLNLLGFHQDIENIA